jgi:hypothetical protein
VIIAHDLSVRREENSIRVPHVALIEADPGRRRRPRPAPAPLPVHRQQVDLLQAQQDENRIFFAPDCTGSDNAESGCGGANAFTDDGGVGEGD